MKKKKLKKYVKHLEKRVKKLEEPRTVTQIGFHQLSNMNDKNEYDYEED